MYPSKKAIPSLLLLSLFFERAGVAQTGKPVSSQKCESGIAIYLSP
jgi:hypothetical protein